MIDHMRGIKILNRMCRITKCDSNYRNTQALCKSIDIDLNLPVAGQIDHVQRNDDGELINQNEEDQALVLAGYVDQIQTRNYKDVPLEELRGLRIACKHWGCAVLTELRTFLTAHSPQTPVNTGDAQS